MPVLHSGLSGTEARRLCSGPDGVLAGLPDLVADRPCLGARHGRCGERRSARRRSGRIRECRPATGARRTPPKAESGIPRDQAEDLASEVRGALRRCLLDRIGILPSLDDQEDRRDQAAGERAVVRSQSTRRPKGRGRCYAGQVVRAPAIAGAETAPRRLDVPGRDATALRSGGFTRAARRGSRP
jgi:hypothetical protein